jgi:glycerol-3-phosphate acyltransferase PlsY
MLDYYARAWTDVPYTWHILLAGLVAAYLIGSIPFAYIIVKWVTGEDVTDHGTGNVGAMNVRRSTGSWTWFVVAMFADAFKGLLPVLALVLLTEKASGNIHWSLSPYEAIVIPSKALLQPIVIFGTVAGHNYSAWMALMKRRFRRTGKGLATGGGALLAYDWRYFVAVVVVGLLVIALTRYMMAGQVAAAWTLPAAALILRNPDWPFALFMGTIVYLAHHRRFVGMLKGREPRLYVNDRMGPTG